MLTQATANPTILIHGFGPFRQYRRNVTQAILEALPSRPHLHTAVLPVRFEPEIFLPLVQSLNPDYILGLGQCPRGQQIRIERRSFNLMRDRTIQLEAPIDPDGPATLIPTWRIPPNSRRRDSYDAGRYVCNYSMYLFSHYAQTNNCKYAFLHIPKTFSVSKAVSEIDNLLNRLEQNSEPIKSLIPAAAKTN